MVLLSPGAATPAGAFDLRLEAGLNAAGYTVRCFVLG
jgi:hypothetical protein